MHPRPSSLPHPPHTHPSPLSQGVVITDFDQQYQNPYYQSEQDLPLYVLVRGRAGGGGEGRGHMHAPATSGVSEISALSAAAVLHAPPPWWAWEGEGEEEGVGACSFLWCQTREVSSAVMVSCAPLAPPPTLLPPCRCNRWWLPQ